MSPKNCPWCKEPLVSPYVSCSFCDWSATIKRKADPAGPRPTPHKMTEEEKLCYESGAPTSMDLTEQQWYNICRFWPTVARRCKRPFADVGPHNSLHATSRLGPLMQRERPPNDGSLIE